MTAPVWVAGVDGCRAGWMVVLCDVAGVAPPSALIVASFATVLALPQTPAIIAVDMPIGLPDRVGIGGRQPDIEARKVLGKRQSSVFAVPSRSAVMTDDYAAACAMALATSDPPRKIAKQTWHLFPRIREIDALMTPPAQRRVYECHPEVAFWAMNAGSPLDQPKKVKSRAFEPGMRQRRELLVASGFEPGFVTAGHVAGARAGADDFLDACACAWTASRIYRGVDMTFPADPPLDARGLRQEIKA